MMAPALAALITLAASAIAACATPPVAGRPPGHAADGPRPAPCRRVLASDALAAVVAAATPGQALCLDPGRYPGPIVVDAGVTVWGPPQAVVVATGGGATVHLRGAGAQLRGVTIDGANRGANEHEAAVHATAADVVIAGVTVVGAGYGIVVERARGVRVAGNHVYGSTDDAIGQRGDPVRLWETDDAVVEDNQVEDGRDVVIWYSRGATVRNNRILRARYGTHFMYSHHTVASGNRYVDVTVGIFVMYSKEVALTGNLIANAAGAAGIAIGLKDSGTVRIADNVLVRDHVGIYLDATPQRRDETVEITGNQLRLCGTALAFHASTHGVTVRGNDFGGNDIQVRVDGGNDARQVGWDGNWFDDYAGYDLDGDGTGDLPYQLRSFSGELVAHQPALGFFTGTPALALADAAAHLDPLFQPRTVLEDPRPRMAPVAGAGGPR